jgi:hypothetical protein
VTANSSCQPIQGQLTLHLDGFDDGTVVSGVLREIRSAMKQDVYVAGGIQKVIFMGQRAVEVSGGHSVVVTADDTNDNAHSTTTKRLLAASGVLFLGVLIIAMAVIFKGRRRNNKKALLEISVRGWD